MSSEAAGGRGPDSWDEMIARLFRTSDSQRPVYRVDIGKLLSAEAREMLVDAARRAGDLGAADIDTNHLLWASLQRHAMRSLLFRSGADPDTLLAELNREARSAEPAPPRRPEDGITLTPGHQTCLAAGAPDLPGGWLVLHRPRASADGAGEQPGLTGRPDAGQAPGRAGDAAGC